MLRSALVLVGLALCSSPLRPQEWQQWEPAKSRWEPMRTPPFSRYAVRASFVGRPAPVDLGRDSTVHLYRTMLRQGAKTGPNFADHFTVLMWGCGGTDCAYLAIVDALTGRVYLAPFFVNAEISYRRTSRLLVVNRMEATFTEEDKPGERLQDWYSWNGKALVHVASVPMRPLRQR